MNAPRKGGGCPRTRSSGGFSLEINENPPMTEDQKGCSTRRQKFVPLLPQGTLLV